jgi:hypothetical protein
MKEEFMSDERLEDTEAKDEDVEAHKRHVVAANEEATDEPGTEESDDVEAHARRASHKHL